MGEGSWSACATRAATTPATPSARRQSQLHLVQGSSTRASRPSSQRRGRQSARLIEEMDTLDGPGWTSAAARQLKKRPRGLPHHLALDAALEGGSAGAGRGTTRPGHRSAYAGRAAASGCAWATWPTRARARPLDAASRWPRRHPARPVWAGGLRDRALVALAMGWGERLRAELAERPPLLHAALAPGRTAASWKAPRAPCWDLSRYVPLRVLSIGGRWRFDRQRHRAAPDRPFVGVMKAYVDPRRARALPDRAARRDRRATAPSAAALRPTTGRPRRWAGPTPCRCARRGGQHGQRDHAEEARHPLRPAGGPHGRLPTSTGAWSPLAARRWRSSSGALALYEGLRRAGDPPRGDSMVNLPLAGRGASWRRLEAASAPITLVQRRPGMDADDERGSRPWSPWPPVTQLCRRLPGAGAHPDSGQWRA